MISDAAHLLRRAGVQLCWADTAPDARGCVVRPGELARETAIYLDGGRLVRVRLDAQESLRLVAYLLGTYLDAGPAELEWFKGASVHAAGHPDCESMGRERLASATCDLYAPDIDPERAQEWRGEMGIFPTRFWIAKRPHSSVDFAEAGVRL